jgi:hypothetical protein
LLCGTAVLGRCDQLWAFGEIPDGMLVELEHAKKRGIPVRYFDADCREVL